VTQWAKQQACWERFQKRQVSLPPSIVDELVTAEDARVAERDDRKQRSMDSGFEGIQRVMSVKPEIWERVYRSGGLSPVEGDLLRLFGLKRGGVPSEKQAAVMLRLLSRMTDNGLIDGDSF